MTENNNPENIFIYQYVEELISDYATHFNNNLKDQNMTVKELSVLLRIRFLGTTTQHDLVDLIKVSDAYVAKLLRKFEDGEYILRMEDPENRRRKIVKLTSKGIEKTDEIINLINSWENEITSNLTKDEKITLKKILFKITIGDE